MIRRLALLTILVFISAGAVNAQDTTPITKLVLVPAGEFTMGRAGSKEMPANRVRIDAFMLDEHEVTNGQYQAFCEATGAELPVFWGIETFRCGEQWPDHPIVGISVGDAADYAEWVGKRLPTEAEWEYAARAGTDLRFGATDTLGTAQANYKKSEHKATAPVKSYPPNAFGLYDLIGNVREWTADYYGVAIPATALIPDEGEGPLDGVAPRDNPLNEEKVRLGVVRGGGWFSGSSCNAVHVRNGYPRGWGDFNVGFRCARDVQ